MHGMFLGASAFNQPLDSWDVSSITHMESLFYDATSFDQSLAAWDISNVTNMNNIFRNTSMSICNYDSTLLAWATLSPEMYLQVGAQNLQFSEAGAEARDYLISNYNWTFVGDSPGDLEVSAEVSGS